MKTQIIKYKDRELVNLCDMTFQQFMALCSCIEEAKDNKCERVKILVKELHYTIHWAMDWQNKTVSLCLLSWEDVLILAAVLSDEIDRLNTVPMNHWFRETSQIKKDHISRILEALGVTIEAGSE